MPLTATDVLYGFFIPALAAAATLFLLRRLLPSPLDRRYPGAVAAAIGFFCGYALLELAPWQPSAHWHWMPYVLLVAALVTPVALAEGVWWFERGVLYGLVASLSSWLLVPPWEDQVPVRGVALIALAVYITLLAALLENLAWRVPGPILAGVLSLSMVVAAIVLALSGNLRIAQVAGAAAGALTGCAIACRRRPEQDSLQGLSLPFAVLAAGLLFVGRANSFAGLPAISYLLPPLAPLGLWISVSRRRPLLEGSLCSAAPANRTVLAAIFVVLPLAIAVGLALAAESE